MSDLNLSLVLLNLNISHFKNSEEIDQLASSEEASWSDSTLFPMQLIILS